MTLPNPRNTIVFDVDDTILKTQNRDYENSRPKVEVIEGMRALKKAGWRIVLHTSRGQGRSGGDIEAVRDQVTKEIKDFCEKFQVPCDELILGKVWAHLYVDDRAMRPEAFAANYQKIIEGYI